MEDEFRDVSDVGIVLQAYLPESQRDAADLLEWARRRGTPVWVRLVKGAYWDYETVVCQAHGWPVPVYQQKWESDANFERLTRFLMENYRWLRPALGSHNLRSLSHGIACARQLGVPEHAYELQMLYGMGAEQAQLLADRGHRVRIYTPFGELIPGMAYLVRRLLENTSNDSFLRQSFTEHVSIEELLMKPADAAAHAPPVVPEPVRSFTNEPPTDFSRAEARQAMERAVNEVAAQFGKEYPLVINGRAVESKNSIVSRNPSHKSQVVGLVSSAGPEEAALGHRGGPPCVQAMVPHRTRLPRRIPRAGGRRDAQSPLRAGRLGGPRVRQAVGRGGCRRGRGDRFLHVLRRPDPQPGRRAAAWTGPGRRMFTRTARAAWPRSSPPGTSRWRS